MLILSMIDLLSMIIYDRSMLNVFTKFDIKGHIMWCQLHFSRSRLNVGIANQN